MNQPITIPIQGMHCASCAITVEKTLTKLAGVEQCTVNYATEKATIAYDPKQTSILAMSERIKPLGYSLIDPHANHVMADGTIMSGMDHSEHLGLNQTKEQKLAELNQQAQKVKVILPITIAVFFFMLWEIAAENMPWLPGFPIADELYSAISFVLATFVLLWIGGQFVMGVVRFIQYRVANMDTLVGIGTLTAYIYSSALILLPSLSESLGMELHTYFDVTIVVIGFVFFGKFLEARSKLSTGAAIEKLIGLQAKTALVVRENIEIEIPITDVKTGDTLIIKPGSKIAVDGIVTNGESAVDESMITGESIPVDKTIGDNLTAGTINKHGALRMQATKVGSETLLSQIIKLVESAQGSRAPVQRIADQISAIFVPVVLIIAMLTLIVWIVVGAQYMPLPEAVSFALVSFVGVLVIACPCALGLATPTAIIVGSGKGAENGILIKDAASLELLHSVDTIVTDKTGTITSGKPVVTDIISQRIPEDETIRILAALEKNSEHPLAHAIMQKAAHRELPQVNKFKIIAGQGLTGFIDGQEYYAGNLRLANELHLTADQTIIARLAHEGKTPVLLMTNQEILAYIAIADTVKANVKDTITKLHQLGIKVVMLTGDNKQTAAYIAAQVGIDDVIAEVLPQDKASKVAQLRQAGKIVGMVGDGINDAPALAEASIGIAMGTGSDIAIESAQITLLGEDFSKVVKAIKLSNFTMRTIKQNLFWAFAYNLIGIPLAAGVFYPLFGVSLNPAFAGLAMAFSSIAVIANSLFLSRKRI